MKVNQAGVMPVIFASSVLLFPGVIAQILPFGWAEGMANVIRPGSTLYIVLYGLLTNVLHVFLYCYYI